MKKVLMKRAWQVPKREVEPEQQREKILVPRHDNPPQRREIPAPVPLPRREIPHQHVPRRENANSHANAQLKLIAAAPRHDTPTKQQREVPTPPSRRDNNAVSQQQQREVPTPPSRRDNAVSPQQRRNLLALAASRRSSSTPISPHPQEILALKGKDSAREIPALKGKDSATLNETATEQLDTRASSSSEGAKGRRPLAQSQKTRRLRSKEDAMQVQRQRGKRQRTDEESKTDRVHQLSKNRWVAVTTYRGIKLISIREYYEKNGKLLPATKGISLTALQWKELKMGISAVDAALRD